MGTYEQFKSILRQYNWTSDTDGDGISDNQITRSIPSAYALVPNNFVYTIGFNFYSSQSAVMSVTLRRSCSGRSFIQEIYKKQMKMSVSCLYLDY